MSRSRRLRRLHYLWAPVVFYVALIYFMSSLCLHFSWLKKTQKIHADWGVHVVEYCLFGFLLARALWRHRPFWRSPGRVFIAVLAIGALYGALDEFHQSFVPNRDASSYDLAADAVGLALGAWIWIKKQTRIHA